MNSKGTKDMHYVRAIDTRGRELSKSAFSFSNTEEGFARVWDVHPVNSEN